VGLINLNNELIIFSRQTSYKLFMGPQALKSGWLFILCGLISIDQLFKYSYRVILGRQRNNYQNNDSYYIKIFM
jgi:hypothetical protein